MRHVQICLVDCIQSHCSTAYLAEFILRRLGFYNVLRKVFKICDKYKIMYANKFLLCTGIQLKQSSINYMTNELCDIV